jgi:hypothetical protein
MEPLTIIVDYWWNINKLHETKHLKKWESKHKEKRLELELEMQQTKGGVTKGQRNKLSYRDPTSCKKHIKEWKGKET